jgi:hypothetical protein
MQCGAACWVKDAGAGKIVLGAENFFCEGQMIQAYVILCGLLPAFHPKICNNPTICLIFLTNGTTLVY